MSLSKLLPSDDARLRQSCQLVSQHDASLDQNAYDLQLALAEFRRKHGFGRAIAAPQLGIMKRLVALNLGATPFELRNPEITWKSDEMREVWDDCISLPNVIVRVTRHQSISVRYEDSCGRMRHWENLPPDLAELVQHEIDHLNGMLMTDRATGPGAIQPIAQHATLIGNARHQHRLSLANMQEARDVIDQVFLNSPQYNCEPLSNVLDCNLTLKLDYLNPIRSFKGRGASYLVHGLGQHADGGAVVCASAGNWGQALAYCCRNAGRPINVFTAKNANPAKIARMRDMGATVTLRGNDFDAAKAAASAYAEQTNGLLLEDGKIAAVSEGHGTIAIELLETQQTYDTVLVPLGNGALLTGIGRWIKAACPATRVVGVCATGADAMYQSWLQRTVIETKTADTIADGIAIRVPVPEAVEDLDGTVDDIMLVDDSHIITAMRYLSKFAGQLVEPAGASALAGVIAHPREFQSKSVAAIVCGSNLTKDQIHEFKLV